MNSWVVSSNPFTAYRVVESLAANGNCVDWIAVNRLSVGDVVYIYEALSGGGRGGIIYNAEVTDTGLDMTSKIDDRRFWVGGDYPEYINYKTKFNRLRLVATPRSGLMPYRCLKEYDFTAPQKGAYKLDAKTGLLEYTKGMFKC